MSSDETIQDSPRALVVDDEPQILMIMQFALETAGFCMTTAGDGARAWEHFSTTDFDLVVLDLMVPVVAHADRDILIRIGYCDED